MNRRAGRVVGQCFEPVPREQARCAVPLCGSWRGVDQLAVFDAHPASVLKDESGVILPIDLITLVAEDALAEQLSGTLC